MKLLLCTLLLILSAFVGAQGKDQWRRVFKYEDGSIIELNTSEVTFVGLGQIGRTGRVRFRVVWAKPQSPRGLPEVKYKTHLETVEFKCEEKRFRRVQVTLLDPEGKSVYSYQGEMKGEWERVMPNTMFNRISDPACDLIDEKKRNPDEETQL